MDRYTIVRSIGQGAYGIVLSARIKELITWIAADHPLSRPVWRHVSVVDSDNGKTVAIKKMAITSRNKLQILRELCALRNLHHSKVLNLIDAFCSSDSLSLVTEFVPFHLNDVITDPMRPKCDNFIRFFFEQIVEGVKYIHSMNVMHRDLKPENILVSAHNLIKIADFGQACLYFPNGDHEYEENVATRQYRAPELLFGSRKYTPSVDIWALGCILAEFVNGSALFPGRSDLEQISLIFSALGTPSEETWPSWSTMPDAKKLIFRNMEPIEDTSTIVHTTTPQILDLFKHLITLESRWRWSAAKILTHSFFMDYPSKRSLFPHFHPRRQRSCSVTRNLARLRIDNHK